MSHDYVHDIKLAMRICEGSIAQAVVVLDYGSPGWAAPTATQAEWDALGAEDERCRHPSDKRRAWPMDFKRSYCCACGEELP